MPNKIIFSLHSFRKYGQPKLSKPKELRGIAPIFSIDYIRKKCRCQVFVKGDDVWVKHRDYFSPSAVLDKEDLGMPLSYIANKYLDKKTAGKFVYEDAWGAIVLRQEAWIKVGGIVTKIKLSRLKSGGFIIGVIADVRSQQEKYHGMEEFELCCTAMERFWENVVMKLRETLPDEVPKIDPIPKRKLKRKFTEAGDYFYEEPKKQYKGFDMI